MIWDTGKNKILGLCQHDGGTKWQWYSSFPSVCSFSPPLGRLLLSKLDPLALLAVGGALSVIIAKILIDIE